jgi:hypothetical protein
VQGVRQGQLPDAGQSVCGRVTPLPHRGRDPGVPVPTRPRLAPHPALRLGVVVSEYQLELTPAEVEQIENALSSEPQTIPALADALQEQDGQLA